MLKIKFINEAFILVIKRHSFGDCSIIATWWKTICHIYHLYFSHLFSVSTTILVHPVSATKTAFSHFIEPQNPFFPPNLSLGRTWCMYGYRRLDFCICREIFTFHPVPPPPPPPPPTPDLQTLPHSPLYRSLSYLFGPSFATAISFPPFSTLSAHILPSHLPSNFLPTTHVVHPESRLFGLLWIRIDGLLSCKIYNLRDLIFISKFHFCYS
jgi:hypothetical protein